MPAANNYDPEALIDDGSCEVAVNENSCSMDLDGDGTVATGDLLMILTAFGEVCYKNTLHPAWDRRWCAGSTGLA